MPPESDGKVKEITKEAEPFFGVDSQGLASGSEERVQEATSGIDRTDSSPEPAMPNKQTTFDNEEESMSHRMDEQIRALENAKRSHEAGSRGHKRYKWVPLGEIEPEEEQSVALSEQTDLGLELEPARRTIHILGTGPYGKYIAHALAGLAEAPPVTILMHQPLLMQKWHEEGASINILKGGKIDTKSNFNIESSSVLGHRETPDQRFPGFGENLEHTAEQPNTVIENLIVTTEGFVTISALTAIKHRLRPTSSICFIQNGLGVTNLVNEKVFPDPKTRPGYMLGNMSHDLLSTERKYTLVERNPGRIYLNISPRNLSPTESRRTQEKGSSLVRRMDYGWTPNSKWIMRVLSRTPELDAVGLAEPEYYQDQLGKIAVNSVIGPLSVLYDCYNEDLLCNYNVTRSMRLLIKDISNILQQLPELSRAAKIEKRFSATSLERVVIGVCGRTGKNSTSMLQAVRRGERSDVDFYNGYLLTRAMELGIECPVLEMMVAMVKAKQLMRSHEQQKLIPFKV